MQHVFIVYVHDTHGPVIGGINRRLISGTAFSFRVRPEGEFPVPNNKHKQPDNSADLYRRRDCRCIGAAREEQRVGGQQPTPRCPKYIFNKKKLREIYLFFCPEPYSGGLQRPFKGQECPPPRGVSPPR